MEKYYTEKELITVKELEKRWHIDTEELARIVVENSLTIFCSKYARERKCCIFFVGFEIQYEKSIDGIFECLENFTDGYKIIKNKEGNSESVDIFLLFSDIQKYETNKPFLVGDPVEADYRAAVDKTIRDKEKLPPMPPPLNGGHSEELAQARVAKLEKENQDLRDEIERLKEENQHLAEKSAPQAQGVDAEQAEALEGIAPAVQPGDNTRDRFEEEPIGKGRGSYLAMIDALTKAISVKDRDLASWLEAKIAAIGYDGPKAQAIRNILNDVAAHRKKKIGR